MSNLDKYKSLSKDDYTAFAGSDWPSYEQFQRQDKVEQFVYDEIDEYLSRYTKFDDPAFCVLPFYGIEYPANLSCCIMQPADINQVKHQMLNGVRPAACQACWKLEDAGLVSDRIIKNTALDYYTKQDLSSLYNDAKTNKSSILSYKIDTSTVCNATCTTCNGNNSSSWRRLEKVNTGLAKKQSRGISSAKAQQIVDFPTAKMINFRGGEPLLSKTNFFILEKLIECGNTECFISFTTNGSVIPNNRQLEILSHFENINFNLSIDGVGKVFEYLRYPLKWESVLAMIDFCKEHNFEVSASYTISNLNILYHAQTTQWFKDNDINYINNMVTYPTYFSASALSKEIKNKILSLNNDHELTYILSQHSVHDDSNFEKFKTEILKQDSWKKININDYLPELAKLINLQ